MMTNTELVQARETLLDRAVAFFAAQPDVVGIFLAGSLAAGSADAYSDIDLRIIATHEGQARLLNGRLDWPVQWGDLLFNEWVDGTQHCVSHFRPFLKIDVFYWRPDSFKPSPWFKYAAKVFLDRTGIVERVLDGSRSLAHPPPPDEEVSRVLSKALAGAHEVVRRARRGELCFAQTLLDELRAHMTRLDLWIQSVEPAAPQDLKLERRVTPALLEALKQSYVVLDASEIDRAVVALGGVLATQIVELHERFDLRRSRVTDLDAVALVTTRQVA
jgi:predicted nucleotidyltransferase